MVVFLAIIQTPFQMPRVNVTFAPSLARHWMKFYKVFISVKMVSLWRLLGHVHRVVSKEAELYTDQNVVTVSHIPTAETARL